MNKVNICGIPHEVERVEQQFDIGAVHFGEIKYLETKIVLNKAMSPELEKVTLCHEMLHGILVHIGRTELSQDEEFVQSLAQAIAMGFDVKEME